ncbi:thioredoxin family protein [Alkaliflexus imshenetskii]|uniref:thioredoxin family protein n=1 Tax=Alkaliflexus imshenetskii TaxID=286730 RepID=UPI00047AB749|nr:thioredoxin family protein [Alkaliflexus imshenetskii]
MSKHTVSNIEELDRLLSEEPAVLGYFSHDACSVCKALLPKVTELIRADFALMRMFYCNTLKSPEVSGSLSVFTVPTIIIWFQGREAFRLSRNIGISELHTAILRLYSLLFEE